MQISSKYFCGTDDFISYTPTTFDYIVITISVILVIIAFVLCTKYLFRPGEENKNHIKYKFIYNEESEKQS